MTKRLILIGIIIVAGVLRLWGLGKVPVSPDWDEVSLGYNAYSISETGKDEYGDFLPVVLRSFDDYKPALYAYLAVPFIKLFGLNIFAVRLPSAIFGTLTVLITYFLVKEIFNEKLKTQKSKVKSTTQSSKVGIIALLSAFILAISPWHIQFSRIAFEANIGLALNIFAFLFFLKGLKNHRFLLLSFIIGALNIYMYQGEKVFTPLMFLALIIIFRKEFFSVPKKLITGSIATAFIIGIPMFLYIFTNPDALLRAQGVSVFAEQTQLLSRSAQKLLHDWETGDILGLILDNRRVEFAKTIISGYISHFDLNWLFITGDIARHHAPNMGLLYLLELPFLFIGIYKLVFGEFDKKAKLAVFSYFLLVPLPASITTGVPHAVRTLNFLPTFQIFTAIGILSTLPMLKLIRLSYLRFFIAIFIFSFLVFNFIYYLNQYFVQQNYSNSKEWQYGYKEAIEYIKPIDPWYDKIIVSNRPPLDQSYMFFLFYLKYDPSLYQKEAQYASGGFRENHYFGKFEFRPINWQREERVGRLFMGRPEDFSIGAKVLKTVYYLNGEPAIKIIEGQ